MSHELSHLPLGKTTAYTNRYAPELLCPVPRRLKRAELGLSDEALPFQGADLWNGYELSWLNAKGKPVVAIAEFTVPCTSPNLIESKSFKLYLNSLNGTRYAGFDEVQAVLARDLSAVAGGAVGVRLLPWRDFDTLVMGRLEGECIDELDIAVEDYEFNAQLLAGAASGPVVEEALVSHLLKSNCLITSQPDWASVQIRYRGPRLDREALLRYLVSFREHNEFHEQCVERIFRDLLEHARPERLSVYARYTRRGGLDINPWRSNFEHIRDNPRLARQ
ncbi:MAG: NADPH-dependent 7-cyano-7-deazaguanine reductase QueF [Gammaproteobacteria bacterium]|nr:NADPH-dependent 7-cyano-7-deazaguanine reductase QueF [Gammaproteobacteria bacterium]